MCAPLLGSFRFNRAETMFSFPLFHQANQVREEVSSLPCQLLGSKNRHIPQGRKPFHAQGLLLDVELTVVKGRGC